MDLSDEPLHLIAEPGTSYCFTEEKREGYSQCKYVGPRTLIRCSKKEPTKKLEKNQGMCDGHTVLQDHVRYQFNNDRTFMDDAQKRKFQKITCEDSIVREEDPAFNFLDSYNRSADNSVVTNPFAIPLRGDYITTEREIYKRQLLAINKSVEVLTVNREVLGSYACQMNEATLKPELSSFPNNRSKELDILKKRLDEVSLRAGKLQNARKLQRERPSVYCSFGKVKRRIGQDDVTLDSTTDFECLLLLDEMIEEIVADLDGKDEGCKNICLPQSPYCLKHILLDGKQQIYARCETCQKNVVDFGSGGCSIHRAEQAAAKLATPITSLMAPLSVNVGEGNYSDAVFAKPSSLLKPPETTTSDLFVESQKTNQSFIIDTDEEDKRSTPSPMNVTQNLPRSEQALQVPLITEDRTVAPDSCSRVRPFSRSMFNQAKNGSRKRLASAISKEFSKQRSAPLTAATKKRLAAKDLNSFAPLHPTIDEKKLPPDYVRSMIETYKSVTSGNRLIAPNQMNGLSYESKSSAPFALPATQADRLPKKQGFRIAYRAVDNKTTSMVYGTVGASKSLITRNSEQPISKDQGRDIQRILLKNESQAISPANIVEEKMNKIQARSIDTPNARISGENHNENFHSSRQLTTGFSQNAPIKPASQESLPQHRVLINHLPKKVALVRNGLRVVVGHPQSQQNFDGTYHTVSTPLLTTASRVGRKILRLPLYQKESLQNKSPNLQGSMSQSETELKKVNIQFRDSNGHLQSIMQATVPNNSISNGPPANKSVEDHTDEKSNSFSEPTSSHAPESSQIQNEKNETITSPLCDVKDSPLPSKNENTGDGWQRVSNNPLDMLAHAALSQAAQSTDSTNEPA